MDALTATLVAIRDARTAKKAAFVKEEEALLADEAIIKAHMLAQLNQIGANSVNTDHGTIMKTEKIRANARDWSAFYDWVMEDKDRFEAIEKRIKSTFIKSYLDEHQSLPPGVDVYREYEVSVRRANTSEPGGSPAEVS